MTDHLLLLLVLFAIMMLVYKLKKLTLTGTFAGGLVAVSVYLASSYQGILILGTFFLLATLATSWKKKFKEDLGISEENKGRRNAWQVLANGGVAALIGIVSIVFPEYRNACQLMIAGSFSAAIADTLSSELGNIYGKRYFNILSLKADKRGLDGVVSLEGTIAGLIGSTIIALIFAYGNWSLKSIGILIFSGLTGNLADSILGASLERKGILKNNQVNFINTLTGALVALLLANLF